MGLDMIKESVREYLSEVVPEAIILDNHSYDNSIIGTSDDGRLIYDFKVSALKESEQ